MNGASMLARDHPSLFEDLRDVTRGLKPSHLAAAIALGLANHVLVLLVYFDGSWRNIAGTRLLALAATLAAVVVADRQGRRAGAWSLLALAYAVLAGAAASESARIQYLLSDQIISHVLAFAVFVADRQVLAGRGRRMTYMVAGLVGVAAGGLLVAVILHLGPDSFAGDESWREESTLPHFVDLYVLYRMFHWLLFGGAAVLFYGERRLAEEAARRLHSAELARLARSRQIIESRLQLMQARIEPRFLFTTLERVKRLYAREPEAAECMLDELGAFLRASMPQMRESYSTLGQEAELVRAYVTILGIHFRNRLDCTIEVPAELAQARLPSMMLLPLVDQLIAPTLGSPTDCIHLRVRASQEHDRMRLVVGSTGPAPAKAEEMSMGAIEDRLNVLYGREARVVLSVEAPDHVESALEIPLEWRVSPADPRPT